MAVTSNKKVVVARFERAPLHGFLQVPGGLTPEAAELLTPDGTLLVTPFQEIKVVCFVRDFEDAQSWREHRTFASRPKTPGLWVRLRFRDGDELEGLLPNNLLLVEPGGLTVVPPDPAAHNQRIFVPRQALRSAEVLGVIGSPLRRRRAKPPAREVAAQRQIEMFD